MYYLQSRYYDQNVGRFINSDDVVLLETLANSNINSNNLFAYCKNNSIINIDSSGAWLFRIVCAVAGAALFGGVTYLIGRIFNISGKTLTIAVVALAAAGAILAATLGVKFLTKVAPKLVRWFKNVERNTKVFGPNRSGNIVGVVLLNVIKIMIHRPHIGKHNFYHIQIEVRVARWIVIARIPISGRR